MTTIDRVIEFTVIECGHCAVQFGLTTSMYKRVFSAKEWFYCPNGHKVRYAGESDHDKAQRLAGQLDQERTRVENLRRSERVLSQRADYAQRARKAVSTRLRKVKNRVGNGVCPCCNRTFSALAKHMESQHPHYAAELP